MIFWRGWGILTLIIVIALLAISEFLGKMVFGPVAKLNDWAFSITLVIAGIIIWFVGKALNRTENGHTFCFIPMQFWAPLVLIWAIVHPFINY